MDPGKIAEARKAGYSDQEIADFLAASNPKVQTAREAGYSDAEILAHLAPPPSSGTQAARMVGQGAIGFNDAVAGTVGAPVDAVNWAMRQAGLPSSQKPFGGSDSIKGGIDYVATLPGRTMDAVSQGSLSPFTESRTSRFAAETEGERIANKVGEAAGTVASTVLPAGLVAKAAKPGVMKGVAETVAAQPGMQLAANTTGNVVGEATDNPWLGMAAGFAVPVAAGLAQRTVSAAPAVSGAEAERRALLIDAQKEGIPVSFGKAIDSKSGQFVESVLSKLPFVGNRQAALNEAGKTAFNKAAFDKVPLLKGQGIDAATDGTMQSAFKKVSDRFNDLAANTTIKVDGRFGSALQKVEADYSEQLLSQINKGVMDKLQELKSAATTLSKPGVQAVTIDGRTYQNIRSQLSRQSAEATDGQLRRALGGMIDALDDVAARSIPKDMAKDWSEARRSWRVLSMIDDAVRNRHSGESAVGNIAPGSLDVQAGKDPEMRRLAKVGMRYVGDKTPDSGTALRQLILNGMVPGAAGTAAAVGAVNPLVAAGVAGGGVAADMMLNNPYTRALLARRYANPSDPVVTKGLVATLAGQRALQEGR